MKRRAPKVEKRRGRPWRKRAPAPAVREDIVEVYRAAVEQHADGAALVQAVSVCHAHGRPIPDWIPGALEWLLADFINLATAKKAGKWALWARAWPRRYMDAMISDYLADRRAVLGLTWEEALDEAADHFLGTPAAGGPTAMMQAHKRHVRRGAQRPETHLEREGTRPAMFTARPGRAGSWWDVNGQRYDWRREVWLERPVLLHTRPKRVGTLARRKHPHT